VSLPEVKLELFSAYLVKHHTMKAWGEIIGLALSSLSLGSKRSELHDPAILPPRKASTGRPLDGFQCRSGLCVKDRNPYPCKDLNLGRLANNNKLHWLSHPGSNVTAHIVLHCTFLVLFWYKLAVNIIFYAPLENIFKTDYNL
jgi:hypothetical protein